MAKLADAIALEAIRRNPVGVQVSPSTQKFKMTIYFTKYANDKFGILARHRCVVERARVEEAVMAADVVDESRSPLFVARKSIDEKRVLKVVYKKEAGAVKIITFYPGISNGQE